MLQELKNEAIAKELCVTTADLCRWDAESKTLLGSQKTKARRFNQLKLIQYEGQGKFVCKPIRGYNSTTYTMQKDQAGNWVCNCQWSVKNDGASCSHIQALWLHFRQKTGEGNE